LNVDALEGQKERAKEIGSKAITADSIGRSPLMNFVEFYARVEDTHYLLHDHPQEMDELLDAMQQQLLQSTEILCERSVADILYLIEDTSTTLISPQQYRKYCYEHISEHARIANEAGRHLLLHMCGEMKALLPDVARLPVAGWEALTSPPVGDTRLPDARAALPDKCLVGGTNAALWTLSSKEIIAELEADLERMPHHRGIVISSAGVLPPECKPETLKQVCDWVQSYSARM
jgi:uroporphyrinogen-III decarboxylase